MSSAKVAVAAGVGSLTGVVLTNLYTNSRKATTGAEDEKNGKGESNVGRGAPLSRDGRKENIAVPSNASTSSDSALAATGTEGLCVVLSKSRQRF